MSEKIKMSVLPPLADCHPQMLENLIEHSELTIEAKDASEKAVAQRTRNIGAVPVIINQPAIEQVEQLIGHFPAIIYQALTSFKTSKQFADYFGTLEIFHHALQQLPLDTDGVMSRYDVTFRHGELKLLEANLGSKNGGWDLDALGDVTIKNIIDTGKRIASQPLQHVRYRSMIKSFFEATDVILKRMAARQNRPHPRNGNQINILLYNDDIIGTSSFVPYIQAIINTIPNWENSKILLTDDLSRLSFTEDYQVYIQAEHAANEPEQIDVLMLLNFPPPNAPIESLIKARASDQIHWPDDPLYELFGNKALLALVHEPHIQDLLTQEQQQWVKHSIPWGAKLDSSTTQWQGQSWSLPDLLEQHQEQLVLKAITSFGGKEVVIGANTDQKQWLEHIEALFEQQQANLWIVQEFVPSDPIQTRLGQQTSWQLPVWGFFGAANIYGGCVVRIIEANPNDLQDKGAVINTANGAGVLLVTEVEE